MGASKGFVVGNTVRFTNTIYKDSVLTNPTTVTFLVEEPNGTDQAITEASAATGIHTGTFVPTQTGWHKVSFIGAGNGAAYVRERQFYVASSQQTTD
jgi:hypothetical protein